MIPPRFVALRLGLGLSALITFASLLVADEPTQNAAEPARTGQGLRGKYWADFQLFICAKDPTDELKLAAAALGVPVQWRPGEREDLALAVLGRGLPQNQSAFHGSQDPQGYQVLNSATGEVFVAASSQQGLANALYDARRNRLAAGVDAKEIKPSTFVPAGEHKPHFARRATYQFLSSWNLPNLTGGALTLGQWKTHLERMRRLNVSQFYFDLWADQFYHPDHPETLGNKALYDRMRQVCDYAHRLGIRTGMYVFPCQVPTSAFLAHPEARPVEAPNYHGIHLCPSRAWEATNAFNTYAIEYFGNSLDDVVVEMQDPGSCLCADCCRQFPELVLRFIDTYRKIPGGPADRRIDLCSLHFRDWLESPEIDSRVTTPIKDLRQHVFEHLPEGTLLFDIDNATLDMGRQYKLKPVYFFFDLDPENGIENWQVFPHVKLRRIEQQVRQSVEHADDGILAYRMMPLTQYVTDYVLFRKLWDPKLEVDAILAELAAELKIPPSQRPKFVQALRDLDAWDEEHDLDALRDANRLLGELATESEPAGFLVDLRDLVTVQTAIGEFWSTHQESVARADFYPPAELVEQVYKQMLDRPIFEAYTAHQHWELRAHEIIGQRLRWWLQTIDPAKKSAG